MKALDRSRDKFPFEVAIRGFYIAKKEAFNPINVTGMVGSFRQYNSNNLNGFKLGWVYRPGRTVARLEKKASELYGKGNVESLQTALFFLAALQIFPRQALYFDDRRVGNNLSLPGGGVAQTPTLERILFEESGTAGDLPR